MSERITNKRESKRQAILDAAAQRFAREGYGRTRMADIARDIGLGKPALYYYFDSKESLLVGLIESRVGAALESLESISLGPDPAMDKITRAVESHLRVFHNQADVFTIFNSERLHLINAETAAAVDAMGRNYEAIWAKMLTAGIAEGSVRQDLDVPIAVKSIMGMLNSTLQWFDPAGRLSLDDLTDEYVNLVRSLVHT